MLVEGLDRGEVRSKRGGVGEGGVPTWKVDVSL
jgi:hypothetical protein